MTELRFHPVHGANISLSEDGLVARHLPGYGKSLVFSSRPVRSNERVSIKFLKLSDRQSNTICFGFTSNDPATSADLHSSYLDLFRADYWIWPLFKTMCVEGAVLSYHFTRSGEVHFGIDGREVDAFYKKVDMDGPLWAILDIDGDSTTVEMVPSPGIVEEPEAEPEVEPEGCYEAEEEEEEGELCKVCCQRGVDAVLYKCGHMAMCFDCAMRQKKGTGGGQCPFCRAEIKDVIRIYK